MITTLTTKQLHQVVREFGISINPNMTKKRIMEFLGEACIGNNIRWKPVYNRVIELDILAVMTDPKSKKYVKYTNHYRW